MVSLIATCHKCQKISSRGFSLEKSIGGTTMFQNFIFGEFFCSLLMKSHFIKKLIGLIFVNTELYLKIF